MTPETGKIEFSYSLQSMIGLFLGSILMTALSALIALHYFPRVPFGSYAKFIGYVGALFFGLCTAIAGWRLLTHRGPGVTLKRSGFRDVRVAAEEIPWTAITTLGRVTMNKQNLLTIEVILEVEERLTLTRIARWSRGPNRQFGIDALCTSAQGLNTTFDTLYDVCEMHLRRVHQGAAKGDPLLPTEFSLNAADRF